MQKRTLFKIALAVKSDRDGERYTARQFAADVGISEVVLHSVLRGETTSARVQQELRGFIAQHLSILKRHLERGAHLPTPA